MKKVILVLALVLIAATVSAGDGKSCDVSKAKHTAKSVELTGTVVCADGDCEKATFRVANSDQQYDLCHKSKASLKSLGTSGKAVQVKGKLVNCSEGERTELVIESAKSV